MYRGVSPGRLDVMGGIADYSGSLLLQMPIAEQTIVELDLRDDGIFKARTNADVPHPQFQFRLSEIAENNLQLFGEQVKQMPGGDWAVYVLGCFKMLALEKGLAWNGAELTVHSNVPAGKGVSSSAAIEVAAMHAIGKAYGIHLDPLELALLAQRVENQVVGAACGLMDQLSVNLGRKDHLLPIICQPHTVLDPIPIPAGIRFFGLDSGVRHAVGGASYGDVRTAAFMAYTVAMMSTGQNVHDKPYGGFLANISLEEFNTRYAAHIPQQMTGRVFLEKYGVHIDPATSVDPSTTYSLLACALHPVQENHRIKRFRDLISLPTSKVPTSKVGTLEVDSFEEMGQLMLGSHEGYNAVGLGEPVTNRIVDLVKTMGMGHGIAGARISGGGSGGTVTVMVYSDEGYEILMKIREIMEAETGKKLKLFEGSSDGAHYIN